ncbi:hypothetical protein F3H15_35315, partial [Pseudomonas aeruginosa]
RDFCGRYIACLKTKMQSENLLRTDYGSGTYARVLGRLRDSPENSSSTLVPAHCESLPPIAHFCRKAATRFQDWVSRYIKEL